MGKTADRARWMWTIICGMNAEHLYKTFSQMSQSCIFTVDVFKERYDFASDNFANIFGYTPTWIKTIRKQGDLLEERIHPDDRAQLIEYQIEHGQFIYSLPQEQRNDYQQIFQIRMLNARQEYVKCNQSPPSNSERQKRKKHG